MAHAVYYVDLDEAMISVGPNSLCASFDVLFEVRTMQVESLEKTVEEVKDKKAAGQGD